MTRTTETTTSRRSARLLIALALTGAAGLVGACGRAHLSDNYGQSYTAWFNAQHIQTPTATSDPARRALSGLDAQEAAAISKNYRKNVGGGQEAAPGQMVMIGQTAGANAQGFTPPPSVPGGQ